jgi:23S rRNA-/tRNA-specific pseudouridylate synthase/8-oxo-dGTP pyrophosphatase MutT (NUDIX family)
VSCCLEPPLTSWLKNGTRVGYAVHKEATLPMEVAPNTPLPEVLVSWDPVRFPTMSRARKACRRGMVLVNGVEGRCIATAGGGDVLAFQSRVAPGFTPRGKPPFELEVVYEDDSIAVVLKPAGVCTHPPSNSENRRRAGASHGHSMRTAVQYALKPPPVGTEDALYRPHLCHRLDRPTSGLMLCAKSRQSLNSITRGFRERTIHKQYRAIVCGSVEGTEGLIDSDIMGRSSLTRWRVLSRSRSLVLGGGHLTELALFPLTGRTHQLRRHCAEVLKVPILGDHKYGGEDAGSGLFLSAVELMFVHPAAVAAASVEGGVEPMRVSVEAPRKFGELLRREQSRWEKLQGGKEGSKEGGVAAVGAAGEDIVEPYTQGGLRRVAAVVLTRLAESNADEAGAVREVLLELRSDDDLDGMLCFPGGKHEPGETMLQAAARESRQELAVELGGGAISIGAVETSSASIEHFVVRDFSGEPTPKEGQQIRWVRVCELEAMASALTPSARGALPELREYLDVLDLGVEEDYM